MAFTERYVTTSGSSGNGGTNDTSDAWDFVTGWQAAGAGVRINVKSGTYTISTGASIDTLSTSTTANPLSVRGYNTTPGDLVHSRDTNGDLVTTGMPVLNLSAATRLRVLNDGAIIENLNISGSRSNELLYMYSSYGYVYNCRADNSYNLGFSSSAAISCAGYSTSVVSCDCIKSGTDTANGIVLNSSGSAIDCKVTGNAGPAILILSGGSVIDCVLYNSTVGVDISYNNNNQLINIVNCTIYNCSTAGIRFPNNVSASSYQCVPIVNCHITDCGYALKNDYTTAVCPNAFIRNRTRDNTNANNNTGNWPNQNPLTTDNGTASSDYIDTASKNFKLRPTAVGRAAGLVPNRDIGAHQAPSSSNSVF